MTGRLPHVVSSGTLFLIRISVYVFLDWTIVIYVTRENKKEEFIATTAY